MKFGAAKSASMGMLLSALVIGVSSILMFEEGTSAYIGSAVLIVLLFIASLLIMIVWGRCPYCGMHLFYGLYKWKTCPKCRRALSANDKYSPSDRLKAKRK